MRKHSWLLIAGAVFVLAATGCTVRPVVVEQEWACRPDRIGIETYTGAGKNGAASRILATAWTARYLAGEGLAQRSTLQEALSGRSGANRFDPRTGSLYLEGKIVAQMTVVRNRDGTWSVGDMRWCPPDPHAGAPEAEQGLA